ncbi:MAG: hypothetical protein JWO47_516 [Candidatus Saccharibacteria bacterium]|nr:hypothetical protein [Candidatus Saccharibacteria bacterium]
MKMLIFLGTTVGGVLGGLFGQILDKGNGLGGWSLLFGGLVGPLLGLWAGYKIGKYMAE